MAVLRFLVEAPWVRAEVYGLRFPLICWDQGCISSGEVECLERPFPKEAWNGSWIPLRQEAVFFQSEWREIGFQGHAPMSVHFVAS